MDVCAITACAFASSTTAPGLPMEPVGLDVQRFP